ncbi:hypothetical protein O6H91_04G034500 [Diphasiastrum complanatum]|uniref:Uncharacterized protein n=1 Tax=Diphasiastrum complanatum TaxID=34168 RepID=A0ACC2DVR2_DIPCM|nr:hypothetical protein O6H91_04G034500 [Diphasiastrum complanatum]
MRRQEAAAKREAESSRRKERHATRQEAMASGDMDSHRPSLGAVAILGAGVSGLAAAYRLQANGAAVTVFDTQESVGGKVQSVRQDRIIWEKGANTMPLQQSKRYIVRDGKPIKLPGDPLALIASNLLSPHGKLRIMLEPFIWKKRAHMQYEAQNPGQAFQDESVGEFMERHFGREVVDYLVDPFLAGTSGSDPSSVSIRHTFPELWALEERYGSIIVGAILSGFQKRSKSSQSTVSQKLPQKKRRGSFSFVGGLQTLANALVTEIGERNLKLDASVTVLACNQQGNPSRDNWTISYLRTGSDKIMHQFEQHFDAVITTMPLHNFREVQIKKDGKPYSIHYIPPVVYEPISVLVTAFRNEDVKRPLEGFGVLVPSKEQSQKFQTLGTLFSSSMFPDRAPPDQTLFTTFIGGSRNPSLCATSKEELLDVVLQDLHRLLGVEGKPTFVRHTFWEKAFPRYDLGYQNILTSLEKLERDLPGLCYAGNHKGGLAVGKCLISGLKAAEQVLTYLESSGSRKLFTMALSPD